MKILFLTRRFYPHIGGVEKHILKISKQLMLKGHEVTIITENQDESAVQSGLHNYESIPVIYISVGDESWFKKWKIWGSLLKHIKLILSSDVIHAHDVFFWFMPFRAIFFWKSVFTTFHGDEKVFPPQKKAILVRRLSEFLSRGTIDVGSYLSKWYGTHPDVTIWGAVDEAVSKGQSASELSSFTSPLKILFLGRLDKDISVDLYANFLQTLNDQNISFQLTVCGDGPMKYALEPYGKIVGFVKHVESYIQKSDIVFCSSYLAILESLSHRKRVVALYANPMKKDYLYMTPWKDYLSSTLPDRPFSAEEAKKLEAICAELTWSNIAKKYEELWTK